MARTAARVAVVPRPPLAAAALLGRTLLASVPWIVATPYLIQAASRLPWRPGTRLRTLAVHLGLGLVWSGVEATWAWTALSWSGQPILVGPAVWYLARLDQTLFLYLCLVGIGAALRHRRRLDAALLAGIRLEAQLLQARLHVLHLQLHPHFLFNTLNAVSELVHRDAEAARRVLASLTELLRRSLQNDSVQEEPLREELALLAPYIAIQETRFGGGLTIAVEAEPDTLQAVVPRLLLQPLVENAIRHGTARRAGPGHIVVRARLDGERLVLEVEDDGPGPGPRAEPREGVGLGNTRARLRELYGARAALTLTDAPVRGSIARLECPLRLRPVTPPGEPEAHGRDPVYKEAPGMPRPWRTAPALALGWALVGFFGAQEDYLIGRLAGTPEPFAALLLPRLGEAFLWLLLTPPVLWLTRGLAGAGLGWPALAGGHLLGAAVACAAHIGLTLALVSPGLEPGLVGAVLVIDLSVYAALAAAGHAWTVRRQAAERRAAAERLEGELAASRLDLVRWRLRPELLFRTLDAIGERAATDPAGADDLTGRLGELLRLLLPSGPGELVPLRAELDFLAAYLDVSRRVWLVAPALETAIAPGAEWVPVPGMLLQPLADVVAGGTGGELMVDARLRNGALSLVVRGPAVEGGPDHPAVEELRRRLTRLYGHGCDLHVERAGGTMVATLAIPGEPAWRAVA